MEFFLLYQKLLTRQEIQSMGMNVSDTWSNRSLTVMTCGAVTIK